MLHQSSLDSRPTTTWTTSGWSGEWGGDRCEWACRQFTVARQRDACRAFFRGNKDRCNVLTDMLLSICGAAVWHPVINLCNRYIVYRISFNITRQNIALFRTIIQRSIINIRQPEYYCITDKLKYHNLHSKYPLFSLTQVWIRMSYPRHSVAVTLSCISGDRT